MPSFSSHFHLPCPRDVERVTQDQAAVEERKRLRREKAMKHIDHQKREASFLDDDDYDEEKGSEGEDEDFIIHQSAFNVSRRSGNGARSSGVDRLASVMIEDDSARKWVTSSPLRGPSLKRPCATTDGGQESLCVASVAPP
jgi:hypothetical protein